MTKHVPSGFKVPISEFEEQSVPFLYENMPLISFHCGLSGHYVKECTNIIEAKEGEVTLIEGDFEHVVYRAKKAKTYYSMFLPTQ